MTPDWLSDPKDRTAAAEGLRAAGEEALAALAAGCALLAAAEDADADGIRARLTAAGGPADAFDATLERLRGDATVADDEALATVRAVKGDAALAQRLARACCALAAHDGDLSPAQTAAARRLCEALNLSPTQFGL